MTQRQPKIIAVILNVRDTPRLLDCLRSLDRVEYTSLGIVVVHNGPPVAGFESAVRFASARVSEVIFAGFNSGFSAGNNLGIQLALGKGADYVLLLNDDTEVAPDFLSRLVEETVKNPPVGMSGSRVFYFSEPGKIWFSGAEFSRDNCAFSFPGADQNESSYGRLEPASTDYVTGCCLLASRKVLETVGLLDEKFFLYWEDSDWGLRSVAAGFKNMVVPTSRIWHKVSSSSGGNDSPLKIYHKTRGHLLFADIHSPWAKKRLLVSLVRDVAWLIFKSDAENRFMRAAAHVAGIASYITGKTGPGPAWLTREN